MSPSRNGSWPGSSPARNAFAASGVVVPAPDEDASGRLADAECLREHTRLPCGHGLIVHCLYIARPRYGGSRTADSDQRRNRSLPAPGYPRSVTVEANYSSGEDYMVEFLGYRFAFNADDFEQRVTRRRRQARARREQRPRRGRDRGPGRARGGRADRGGAQPARAVPRPPLGAALARRGRVARLLAAEARLPQRLARPPGQGRPARGGLGRDRGGVRLPRPARRPRAARARTRALLARGPVPALSRFSP